MPDLVRLGDLRHERDPGGVGDDLAQLEHDDEGVDQPQRVGERKRDAARRLPDRGDGRERAEGDGVDEPAGHRREHHDRDGRAEEQDRDRPWAPSGGIDPERQHQQRHVVAEGADRAGGDHQP